LINIQGHEQVFSEIILFSFPDEAAVSVNAGLKGSKEAAAVLTAWPPRIGPRY
jgi:hypothetical protein